MIQPLHGIDAAHFVAGEGRDIDHADALAQLPAFIANDVEGIGAPQRGRFLKARRREVKRCFEPERHTPAAACFTHVGVRTAGLQRPPGP